MDGGYFMHSGILFSVAKAAYQRTTSAPSDRTGGQNDTLVAILFSAATLESFIMETALTAEGVGNMGGTPMLIRDMATAIHEAENSRGSARLKYILAKAILPGDSYDKGAQPFQDFDLLFSLRDHIVHMKPEKITEEPHKMIKRLQGLNLCAEEEPNVKSSWLSQVSTPAVARWSCNVVARIVQSVRECFPPEDPDNPAWLQFLTFTMNSFSAITESPTKDA